MDTAGALSRTLSIAIVIVIIVVIVSVIGFGVGYVYVTHSFAPESSSTSSKFASGLSLYLSAVVTSNGSVMITVDANNTRGTTNNVTVSNEWQYSPQTLNPYNPCGAPGPVGLAIFRGYYDMGNFTGAQSLILYDASVTYMCTTAVYAPNSYYLFSSHSDRATFVNPLYPQKFNTTLSLSFTAKGFWSTNSGVSTTFHSFPVGTYTILGADEWGNIVLVHLQISHA
ncbi:MAG: hypothetical protein JRN15_11045 [Nitrososphaerota archaeon]|nr:hypothetical protein [Nitrososphaerota archaeon]